jgi:hypothetical protein
MQIFKCRSLKPQESPITEIEAETIEGAAEEFHFNYNSNIFPRYPSYSISNTFDSSAVNFMLVEVDGEEFVSRFYSNKIWRKGGVKDPKSFEQKLKEIADGLGWKKDPNDLVSEDWPGEEKEWI